MGRHYSPSEIKYRGTHPQINITVPAAIKARVEGMVDEINQNKRDLGVYDDRKKETISKWCRVAITNIFNSDFQKELLTEAKTTEIEKEARVAGRNYYEEKRRAADELHEKVVKYRDSLIEEGFKQGRREGEVRGRERAEREFEGRRREAEEGREEARAAGRREEHEKNKKQYTTLLDEREEECNRLLKEQRDVFEKEKEVYAAMMEKFEVRKTEPEAQFKDGLRHPSNAI